MTAPFPQPATLPPEAPLEMRPQSFRARPAGARRWRRERAGVLAARLFVFGFAGGVIATLGLIFLDWFRSGGVSWIEAAIILTGMFTAFWIALSVATAILGCLPRRARPPAEPAAPLDIAILLPLYGEPVAEIFDAAKTLMRGLARAPGGHRFALYVLSDTRDPGKAMQEARRFGRLAADLPESPVFYRRRDQNHRFKAGNIEDWVRRWGGAHDAMLVLDADSQMAPDTVTALADRMAAEPRLGLLQTIPHLIGGETVFARLQQFSNTIYGATLGRGLALWSGASANYWGHNALIRTRAFAEAACLPDLPGRRPFGGVILSHDFVEAALLRRAGWEVRFDPNLGGSFEGQPETAIAFALRDRRWCQGNLQHLRLLGARGLHPLSRMHLFQGAMSYIASLGWFALMVLWVLVGAGQGDGAIRYFSEANPLFPAWPEMDLVSRFLILTLIYGMLVAPKVLGALAYLASDPGLGRVGGPLAFWTSFLLELVLSVLFAPMMMVQNMLAVLRTLAGRDTGWRPAAAVRPGVLGYLRFHAAELALGAAMTALYLAGALTLWLLPIALMLLAAPGLSALTALRPRWAMSFWVTPQEGRERPAQTDMQMYFISRKSSTP